MSFIILSRAFLQKHNFLVKQVTPISPLPTFKPFSTNQTPQTSHLPITKPETQHKNYLSLANHFLKYGFTPTVHDFLANNKPLLNSNLSELGKSLEILLSSFKLHKTSIVSLVCNCPSVLDLEFLKNWEVVMVGFDSLIRFPSVVCSVLKFSRRFQIDPRGFGRCVNVLRSLGFSDRTIVRVLEEFPGAVMLDECEIRKRMDFWALQGIKSVDVDQIYNLFPGALQYRVENRLKPLLKEFFDMGLDRRRVREEIVREPRILGLELGELRRFLELLRRLRCRELIKEKIMSKGLFNAGFAVKQRVDCLCRYGLIRGDALNILKREPRSILYGIEDMEKKMDFLLEKMKFTVACLFEVPEYLGVNFDKQIVPRFNVIEYLRCRGGLGFEVGLRDIIKPTRLKFYNLYVKPYPECEKLYGRFSIYVEANSGHPTGLWKHFKPPKHPYTKDDAKHLKSFTELIV